MKPQALQEGIQSIREFGRSTVLPIVAVGAATLLAADIIPVQADARQPAETQPVILSFAHLRSISQLPGFKLHVSEPQREKLAAATLKLTERYYGMTEPGTNPWYETCTMLDVSVPGVSSTYGLTSNHCFSVATGSTTGSFVDTLYPKQAATNYIYAANEQYDVVDPEVPATERDNFPIGQVADISADTQGVDQALLQIKPPQASDQTAPYAGERPFQDVPAIPIAKIITATQHPEAGQEVALYGIPQASGNTPVAATGRYIGRYILQEADNNLLPALTRALDIVVVPAKTPETDACEHGSSGGGAVTSTGRFFTSLSYRLSTGYGPEHRYDPTSDPELYDQYMIPQIEEALKVKIPEGDTVCGFSVPRRNFGYTLLSGMSNNFIPLKGGGGK